MRYLTFVLLTGFVLSGTMLRAADFTRVYTGKIDGKYGITMQLRCTGAMLSGQYSYDTKKIPIRISGSIDWTVVEGVGILTLLEFDDKGLVTGFFRGSMREDQIAGSWSTPDGSRILPFRIVTRDVTVRPAKPTEKPAADKPAVKAEVKPVVKTEAKKSPLPLTTRCSEKEVPSSDGDMPSIDRTCFFRDFKAHALGAADHKGRYTYTYTMYRKDGEGWVQVSNATLFQQALLPELEVDINQRIKKDYETLKADDGGCFNGFRFEPFLVNQLGIYFKDDQIFFAATFGLPEACMAVDGTIVSYRLTEIQRYLEQP